MVKSQKPNFKPMKLNKEWHLVHPMPKNATFEQRVEWHREHQRNCACRPGFPEKLAVEMRKRGMDPEEEKL